jgi:hypothetical protein
MSNHPVLVRPGALAMTRKQERSLARYAGALQRRVMEVRVQDAARHQIATGRMHDIRDLTQDALQAGGEIAGTLEDEARRRPFFAAELEGIARTGVRGLKTELECFIEDGH